jgi:hypothetical protein
LTRLVLHCQSFAARPAGLCPFVAAKQAIGEITLPGPVHFYLGELTMS